MTLTEVLLWFEGSSRLLFLLLWLQLCLDYQVLLLSQLHWPQQTSHVMFLCIYRVVSYYKL